MTTTPHDKALKPCPFCGGEVAFEQTGKNELTLRCVGVQPSGLRGCGPKYVQKSGIRFTLAWLQGKMTENWNRRAPLPIAGKGDDGWMPIETAPKDGTEILGFGAASYRGKRYAPGRHIAWFDLGKWWGRDPDTEAGLDLMMWRPLPSPPSILKEGAER